MTGDGNAQKKHKSEKLSSCFSLYRPSTAAMPTEEIQRCRCDRVLGRREKSYLPIGKTVVESVTVANMCEGCDPKIVCRGSMKASNESALLNVACGNSRNKWDANVVVDNTGSLKSGTLGITWHF